MHLELTPEALLAQLGYTQNEQTVKQMNDIIAHTDNFHAFSQHIPSFNDALAVEKGYIAMSNSEPYLKIKCDDVIHLLHCLFILRITKLCQECFWCKF